ncbi:MAG: hypothetical protein ACO3A2_01925, partial [Bdellovibrionia bacterium]
MRTPLFIFITLVLAVFLNPNVSFALARSNPLPRQEKEWTFLTFMNGKNNLDSFGALNINQMEKVGSTDQINVVVQWASLKNKSVKRLFINQDQNPKKVTSHIL